MKTANELGFHVAQLALAFNVHLDVHPNMPPDKAAAGFDPATQQRAIRIAPIIDETTYVVALHELGHCLAPLGFLHLEMSKTFRMTNQLATTRDVLLQLEAEYAAWDWAQHHALEWTPVMEYVKRMTLGSYQRAAKKLLGRIP